MKEEKIKVLALLPMELPKEIELDNTLEAMQKFVGGLIECITLSDTGSEVTLVCNDEGKLLNLTPNRLLWDGADYLAGPGFIAGTDGEGNLTSLPPQEMDYYAKKFRAFLIALYPNSKYLAQYTNLYNSTVANKAMYDAMDESQRHIVANGYQAPCSGYFGQMTRCNGDTAFYNFYCDDGSIVENVQVSISNFGKVDNVRYDNIGFIFWSFEALNRDGQWETVGYATTAVVGGDVVKYIETVGFATVRYNDENPWAILETFDAV